MDREPSEQRPDVSTLDLIVLGVGIATYGVAFGATAVAQGFNPLKIIVLSIAAHAGAAQLGAITVISAGGSSIAALATGLLIAGRFIPLGLVVSQCFPPSLAMRLRAAHLLADPSAGLAITAQTDAESVLVYWRVGLTTLSAWIAGSIVGSFSGELVSNFRALGLDAALPALLVGVVVPMLRCSIMKYAAVSAGIVATVLHSIMPGGAPILLGAACGLFVARVIGRMQG